MYQTIHIVPLIIQLNVQSSLESRFRRCRHLVRHLHQTEMPYDIRKPQFQIVSSLNILQLYSHIAYGRVSHQLGHVRHAASTLHPIHLKVTLKDQRKELHTGDECPRTIF